MRVKGISKKILAALDQNPGKRFSVGEVADAVGSNTKAASAALGRLCKTGLIVRSSKGVYYCKERPPAPKSSPKPEKFVEPAATPIVALTVISIDLLVEGEQSEIDPRGFLAKILADKSVLDARVRKITEADRGKLQISFAFADAE